jgi:hypothetical protein
VCETLSFVGSPLAAPRPPVKDRREPTFAVTKKSPELSRTEKIVQILEELGTAKAKKDLAALGRLHSRGRRSDLFKRLKQTVECLKEAGGRTEEARRLYIARSSEAQKASASKQFSRALKVLETICDSD